MTNGEKMIAAFPRIEVRFCKNLSNIRTVDVDIKDETLGSTYSRHTFSREWWDKESEDKNAKIVLRKKETGGDK